MLFSHSITSIAILISRFAAAHLASEDKAPVHLPVPLRRRRFSSSDVGASRGSGSATQLSLPRHHRSPMGSPQFGTSDSKSKPVILGEGVVEDSEMTHTYKYIYNTCIYMCLYLYIYI